MISPSENLCQDQRQEASGDARPIISRKDALALGSKKYFTGRPCPKGHISERYVGSSRGNRGKCVACQREKVKRQMETYRRPYYEKNKNKFKQYSRESYLRNKDEVNKRSAAWTENNRPRMRAHVTKWRENNRDAFRAACRKYANENPEKRSANNQVQRARRRKAEGRFYASDVADIMKKQKGRCAMPNCRKIIRGKKYHVDHIVPLARGGSNWARNIQLLCPDCNMKKGSRDPIDYARSIGALL